MTPEFKPFPKLPRISNENVAIHEKIDGTNAQLLITDSGEIFAGSRNRWLSPGSDNFGFAAWVEQNKEELLKLGAGRFYGEWYGEGIQRGYDLKEKRLALFYTKVEALPDFVRFVPMICKGKYSEDLVEYAMMKLKNEGSLAVPGYMNPEGIVITFYSHDTLYKKTFEYDKGKWNSTSVEPVNLNGVYLNPYGELSIEQINEVRNAGKSSWFDRILHAVGF